MQTLRIEGEKLRGIGLFRLLLEQLPSFVGGASSFPSNDVQSALARSIHVEE